MKIRSLSYIRNIVIFLLILFLILFVLFVVPLSILNQVADTRVANAMKMYPDAKLQYSITTERHGYGIMKAFVYWADAEYENARNHDFITTCRDRSSAEIAKPFVIQEEDGLLGVRCYLSDLPTLTLRPILLMAHDLCCYGNEPRNVTDLTLYIISSASDVLDKIENIDIGHIDVDVKYLPVWKPGVFIIYAYRVS
jgi:hypothetical protein